MSSMIAVRNLDEYLTQSQVHYGTLKKYNSS